MAELPPPLSSPAVVRLWAFEVPLEPSPPDLQALNATFLI
jgi:hypothetical protein